MENTWRSRQIRLQRRIILTQRRNQSATHETSRQGTQSRRRRRSNDGILQTQRALRVRRDDEDHTVSTQAATTTFTQWSSAMMNIIPGQHVERQARARHARLLRRFILAQRRNALVAHQSPTPEHGHSCPPQQRRNRPGQGSFTWTTSSATNVTNITCTNDIPESSNSSAGGYMSNQITGATQGPIMSPATDATENIQRTSQCHRKYTEAWNFGGPTHFCYYCGAKVWLEERVKRYGGQHEPRFNICCQKGKVQLPLLKDPPEYLRGLLNPEGGSRSTKFKDRIRSYNSIFSFTSMGGKVDRSINTGGAPYIFRLNGQNHHKIGSLLPPPGGQPRFSQLYIYDTENEVQNRINSLIANSSRSELDPEIVEGLLKMFDEHNELAKVLRMARDRFEENQLQPVRIRLIGTRASDGRQYNLPTSTELAALIVGNGETEKGVRDVIIDDKTHGLRRISELHPIYMPAQYPLLFPYGEDGYRTDIPHRDAETTNRKKKKSVTMRKFYAFRLQERPVHGGHGPEGYLPPEGQTLIQCGRLRQQYVVDALTCLEETRLDYVRTNQKDIRKEVLNGLTDAVSRGDTTPASVGQRVVLPSSFTGSPRYMIQNYQDAMAICRKIGPPDLFITFTCNPKWPEIKEFLSTVPGQRPEDRPDITARVFKIKLDELMQDLTVRGHFGRTQAAIYTIEFQKRGLPHAHIVLFLHQEDKLTNPEDIDRYITAELPDQDEDPIGYETVVQYMIHGPCGPLNTNSPCMVGESCSKYYPRSFTDTTTISEDGYPVYRRRNNGRTALKNGENVDNTFVVPHNIDLLVKYQAHINVEWCNKFRSIKYLFKYMNKGPDMALAMVEETERRGEEENEEIQIVDEIHNYLRCRYVSGSEACRRIFGFAIQYKDPPVERLSFHLENQQEILFEDNEELDEVLIRVGAAKTTLTEWMTTNRDNEDARTLTYADFPSEWVWQRDKKAWKRRQRGLSIGRIYFAHPTSGEKYYLRMLLNIVRGATCFQDIRTVNGVVHTTYKAACHALGLLGGDNEWDEVLTDAAHWATAHSLRELFVTILLFCEVSQPKELWGRHWKDLSDDIQYRQQRRLGRPSLALTDEQIKNYALYEIELILNRSGHRLKDYADMPTPDESLVQDTRNQLIIQEQSYDREHLSTEARRLSTQLNEEQKQVHDNILEAVYQKKGGMFFVYGSGGTGKTYLWKTLVTRLRSEGHIVLAVASSGIAALLLLCGRTAHSRFCIPIKLDDNSCCRIDQGSDLANLIRKTSLIIWDEAPMVHRHAFEAVDRTFRDIMQLENQEAKDKIFGGKIVVLGGDFR